MIIEIEMNEQEYAFGAKFNYDMYTHHQDGWKGGDLWTVDVVDVVYFVGKCRSSS